MDILKVLQDTNTYADSLEITAPNGERVALGAVRKAWLEREADLARKAGEVEAKAKAIKESQVELANVYSALQTERESLAAREAEIKTKPTASFEDDFITASKTRIEALEALVQKQHSDLQKLGSNQLQMVDTYMKKSWDETAARLAKDVPEGVTVTRDVLLKVAADQGLKDQFGMPDLEKAFDVVVAPARKTKDLKEAEDRGYQRAKDEEMMRGLSPTPFRTVTPADRAVKSDHKGPATDILSDVFEQAAGDPLTARLLSGNVDLSN